jgi:outer membrane receptor for ferrienterochelin and colicins
MHYNPYSIWKLTLAQRIGPAIRLTIAADNVFNYKPDYYYLNAPLTDGITLQVGMSIDVEKLFEK